MKNQIYYYRPPSGWKFLDIISGKKAEEILDKSLLTSRRSQWRCKCQKLCRTSPLSPCLAPTKTRTHPHTTAQDHTQPHTKCTLPHSVSPCLAPTKTPKHPHTTTHDNTQECTKPHSVKIQMSKIMQNISAITLTREIKYSNTILSGFQIHYRLVSFKSATLYTWILKRL